MEDYKLIKADSTVECRKGTLKVETPLGVFLISVGIESTGRVFDMVMVYPNRHPGMKKILIKKDKSSISMVQCKTAKHRRS